MGWILTDDVDLEEYDLANIVDARKLEHQFLMAMLPQVDQWR